MAEYNASFPEYTRAVESIYRFILSKNGVYPEYVCVPYISPVKCSNKFTREDWEDAIKRVETWMKNHDGVAPATVLFKNLKNPDVYVRIPAYNYYSQLTNYTCGVAVLRMILSSYNIIVSEQQLATWASSVPVDGTTPWGLEVALNKINSAYGRNLKIRWVNFKDTPMTVIADLIKAGKRFIINIQTGDSTGWRFPGYSGIWGHYIGLEGVNLSTNQYMIMDPDRDVKPVNYEDLLHATSLISGASLGEIYE